MVRTAKEYTKEYDKRYAKYLDTAQYLFYDKGYDQTSIQEIIDHVGVAKGTFYHYFNSKSGLLDALISLLLTDEQNGASAHGIDRKLIAYERQY